MTKRKITVPSYVMRLFYCGLFYYAMLLFYCGLSNNKMLCFFTMTSYIWVTASNRISLCQLSVILFLAILLRNLRHGRPGAEFTLFHRPHIGNFDQTAIGLKMTLALEMTLITLTKNLNMNKIC